MDENQIIIRLCKKELKKRQKGVQSLMEKSDYDTSKKLQDIVDYNLKYMKTLDGIIDRLGGWDGEDE